jgi:hypothetical protein
VRQQTSELFPRMRVGTNLRMRVRVCLYACVFARALCSRLHRRRFYLISTEQCTQERGRGGDDVGSRKRRLTLGSRDGATLVSFCSSTFVQLRINNSPCGAQRRADQIACNVRREHDTFQYTSESAALLHASVVVRHPENNRGTNKQLEICKEVESFLDPVVL